MTLDIGWDFIDRRFHIKWRPDGQDIWVRSVSPELISGGVPFVGCRVGQVKSLCNLWGEFV